MCYVPHVLCWCAEDVIPRVFAVPTNGTQAAAASKAEAAATPVQVEPPTMHSSSRSKPTFSVSGSSSSTPESSPGKRGSDGSDEESDPATPRSATSSPSKAANVVRGLLRNGWGLQQRLQTAAQLGFRSAVRLLPWYAHFGTPRYLQPTEMDSTVRAAMAANASGNTEAQRWVACCRAGKQFALPGMPYYTFATMTER